MSELIAYGLEFSFIGMGIVFLVLIVIAGLVALIRLIDLRWEPRPDGRRRKGDPPRQTLDNTTLVLISAAVATLLKGRGRIRSIKKVRPADPSRSPWSLQGRAFLHGSHVIYKNGNRNS